MIGQQMTSQISTIPQDLQMTSNKTHLSVDVVIPIYNECDSIIELSSRLRNAMEAISPITWRVIFVENGSDDNSHQVITQVNHTDERFTELRLIRNFGMEGAILAGLSVSDADLTVTMQGDLEDPPELIVDLVKRAQDGFDVVYGEVVERSDASIKRRVFTWMFYVIGGYLTDGLIRRNASDFRVISRVVREFINSSTDQNLFLRTLVMWPSNRVTSVPFRRGVRNAGTSSFNARRLIGFSLVGIFGQSIKPLRLISFLGFASFAFSLLALVGLILRAIFWSVPFAGFGTIVGIQLLFFSITILAIGVSAEYIAMIQKEVRPRPRFIIMPPNSPPLAQPDDEKL